MSKTQVVYKKKIIENIEELPESNLKEVLDFIKFLKSKRKNREDSILKVAGCLSGNSISAKEIEEELYGEFKKECLK